MTIENNVDRAIDTRHRQRRPPDGSIGFVGLGRMGSAMAATVMDLLSAVAPKAVLFLGKCGGLKKTKVGDFILPIAAVRGEGTSNDYLPPEIPALPSFRLQKAVSAMPNGSNNRVRRNSPKLMPLSFWTR